MTVKVQAIRLEAAADHFATANGFAAQTYQGLTDAVGGFSGMAGDDYTSDEFVSSYDEAAQAAVDGVRAGGNSRDGGGDLAAYAPGRRH